MRNLRWKQVFLRAAPVPKRNSECAVILELMALVLKWFHNTLLLMALYSHMESTDCCLIGHDIPYSKTRIDSWSGFELTKGSLIATTRTSEWRLSLIIRRKNGCKISRIPCSRFLLVRTGHTSRYLAETWGCDCMDTLFPWASYQIRKIAGCACAGNAGNVFPATVG